MGLIGQKTLKLLNDDTTIITHSYSSTLLKSLIFAKKVGKNITVICTESRPMNEGVKLANLLGKKGIKVKLVVDSCAYLFLPEANLILVGADSVSSYGLVNKIGTCGLAIAAKHFNKEVYAICNLNKILPKEYPLSYKYQKNPKEIISDSIKNVEPVNYYFDLTPLKFITGFITEKGILNNLEMLDIINKMPINKKLIR